MWMLRLSSAALRTKAVLSRMVMSQHHELLSVTWQQWLSFVTSRRNTRRSIARLLQRTSTTSVRQWFMAWRHAVSARVRRRRLIDKSQRIVDRKLLRVSFDEWKRVRTYSKRVARATVTRTRSVPLATRCLNRCPVSLLQLAQSIISVPHAHSAARALGDF